MNDEVTNVIELSDSQEQFLQTVGVDKTTLGAIRASVFPDPKISSHSIALYLQYCKARNLDPMKRPAHIVPMKMGDVWRDVVMPGIYEYRTTAQRTGQYAGCEPALLGEEKEFTFGGEKITVPESCSFTVYKLVGNHRCPFTHTVYFKECCATKGPNGPLNRMWKKRPIGQMMKCAEAGALRISFPEELGGEMTMDEMVGHDIQVKPEESSITQVQADEHRTLIDEGKAREFYLFLNQFGIEEKMQLQGAWLDHAPKGKKGQWREQYTDLYERGEIEFSEIVSALDEYVEKDNEHAFAEIWNEFDELEKELASEQSMDGARLLMMVERTKEFSEGKANE